jgi:Sec-independent protein translocase protein TatA
MLATVIAPLAFFSSFGGPEMLLVVVIALLLFGKDLPNVMREWAHTFNEFRRHINNVKSELNEAIYAEPERPKLQYHPEFHNRDPLPEAIPAEGKGDLGRSEEGDASGSAETAATNSTNGEAHAEQAELARQAPSD